MNIEPPVIPYSFADLEPAMSRDTVVFHFLRHQRVCYDRMCALLRTTSVEAETLEELVRVTERNPAHHTLYRYAAEVWNHDRFWQSLRPHGGGTPGGAVGELISAQFGGFEQFTREFRAAASAHFGSGWLWLVWRAGSLELLTTGNARTPMVRGDTVLLALDLWEHAYYLDHQNRRAAYVNAFLEELANWDEANRILGALASNSATRAARTLTAVTHHAP
jgi:superoxide dismutase, Fe-Mn family